MQTPSSFTASHPAGIEESLVKVENFENIVFAFLQIAAHDDIVEKFRCASGSQRQTGGRGSRMTPQAELVSHHARSKPAAGS
jgi:hypothetical protein